MLWIHLCEPTPKPNCMKKLLSTLLSSAALTAVLIMSQYQTKAGTIDAASLAVVKEEMPETQVAAPQYSYWVLINSGWALVVVQQ
jgi:hypothetical protein